MNLQDVKKLKDNDEIEFSFEFYPFTLGKVYKIKKTSMGTYIIDDKGIGRPVVDVIRLEQHFINNNR